MSKDIEIKEGEFKKKEEFSKKSTETKDKSKNTTVENSFKNSDIPNESGEEESKGEKEESLKGENRFCDENECKKNDREKYEKCNFRTNIKKSVDNNSGKLRTQLKNNGTTEDKKDFKEMQNSGYPIAAHHIISGNQVFKNLDEIVKLTQGVGYDINCFENGIFLPSNQTNFGLENGEIPTDTHKSIEAFDAMGELGLQ
ncbi:MAG: AHH domain-containing protein, partial [Cetobacterium sp.]